MKKQYTVYIIIGLIIIAVVWLLTTGSNNKKHIEYYKACLEIANSRYAKSLITGEQFNREFNLCKTSAESVYPTK